MISKKARFSGFFKFIARQFLWVLFSFSIIWINSISVFGVRTANDYDGDGRSDLVLTRFDQSNTAYVWHILQSRDGYRAEIWGDRLRDVEIYDSDFDGDGRADIAVVRFDPSETNLSWWVKNSSDNSYSVSQWGLRDVDTTMPQDYDGDGITDLCVYRSGLWFILRSSDNSVQVEEFGTSTDSELLGGDYDGDGKADLTVVRIGNPIVQFIKFSKDGTWATYPLGNPQVTGVLTGDYDGDGRSDVAVWQGTLWLWIRSSDNQLDGVRFGALPGDVPVQGDYDGDGKTDPAVYRRGTVVSPASYFHLLKSTEGYEVIQFGTISDASVGDFGTRTFIPPIGF